MQIGADQVGQHVRIGGKKDGTLTAFEVDCYGTPGYTGGATVNLGLLPYIYLDAIPAPRSSGHARSAYTPPALQPVLRDFAFIVPSDVPADALIRTGLRELTRV